MNGHSRTYEQYCCVMGKNVMMEETRYSDGTCLLHCGHHVICALTGGCRNTVLQPFLEPERSPL